MVLSVTIDFNYTGKFFIQYVCNSLCLVRNSRLNLKFPGGLHFFFFSKLSSFTNNVTLKQTFLIDSEEASIPLHS